MTQKSFKQALAKGALGESIVRQILEDKGWVIYQPNTEDMAHQFDMLGIFKKRTAVAIDIKAKARMNKFAATGVNQNHFEEYKAFSDKHQMPFWIVFVDEQLRKIYGNSIDELEKPRTVDGRNYPYLLQSRSDKPIRLWPLSAMKDIAVLPETQATALTELNQRCYDYLEQNH